MKIHNAFSIGLFGGLGVIVALGIGAAVGNLATILTYVGAALFIALGLDPLVSFLERHKWKRSLAILTVLAGVLGAFTGLVFAIIPVVTDQITTLVAQLQTIIPTVFTPGFRDDLQETIPWLDVDTVFNQADSFLQDLDVLSIGGGVLAAGVTIANAVFGTIIVLILTLYFVSSLASIKRALFQLVPASKRAQFVDLAEQVSASVGRFVMGQGALALVNGVLSFILLTFVFQVKYSALLAFIAVIGSLIPLVGTLTSAIVITLGVLLFEGPGWQVVAVGIYYLVYMQVEAYVISPRIMNSAVQVPGVVVVLAALIGGTLLGVLGALVAIPVAASVLLIIKQVFVPRQNAL
ncbi:putative PurR-regulated permease PerM [Glaciihabitans tibetensis]|uniref:Putative PurR-regulated permease PerM n=1 Tax=Glaciihabitans tibetensis TaxID=1266600 RepID=A0A2T0VIA1_9MICO|nr:AI-2E family transporter [Glaciihabitans tibetensis]PRY69966.1 putative PurR-regulated permease PerM [Glaciihabitans tibetensis]